MRLNVCVCVLILLKIKECKRTSKLFCFIDIFLLQIDCKTLITFLIANIFGCSDTQIALRDPHKHYVVATAGGEAMANSASIVKGAILSFEDHGGDEVNRKIALKSAEYGKYLAAYPGPTYAVSFNGTTVGDSEIFIARHNDRQQYWLKTKYDHYVVGRPDGRLMGDAEHVRRWEKFYVTCLSDSSGL